LNEKVRLIESLPDDIPLLKALDTIGLAPSTWYDRKTHDRWSDSSEADEKQQIEDIVRDHPGYGYRRIKPEYEARTGEAMNHKRLLRLLDETNLALLREVSPPGTNPIKQVLDDHKGHVNLIDDMQPDCFELLTTDFTGVRWNNGSKKAWFMVLLEHVSRLAVGWAVGPSRCRSLALDAWDQVRTTYDQWNQRLSGTVVHQDQDSVYTSWAWPRAVVLESGCVMSFSENGAKENPWIESFWGRMKNRCESRLIESTTMKQLKGVIEEEMNYYNCDRRHSSLGYMSPIDYLQSDETPVENVTINRA